MWTSHCAAHSAQSDAGTSWRAHCRIRRAVSGRMLARCTALGPAHKKMKQQCALNDLPTKQYINYILSSFESFGSDGTLNQVAQWIGGYGGERRGRMEGTVRLQTILWRDIPLCIFLRPAELRLCPSLLLSLCRSPLKPPSPMLDLQPESKLRSCELLLWPQRYAASKKLVTKTKRFQSEGLSMPLAAAV